MTTYTPGYKTVKFHIMLFGLLLFCLGVAQLLPPAITFIIGIDQSAKISKIVSSNAAGASKDSNAKSEREFYSFWATTEGMSGQELPLNVHYGSESAYHVGDRILVAYVRGQSGPDIAYVMDDLQTWAIGILFVTFGAAFSLSFYLIWSRADLPIELPIGTPEHTKL